MAGNVSFGEDEGGVMSEINVTPLVDVVLVLLIVFMITVPAIVGNAPVKVDLPTTSAYSSSSDELPLNVFLKREADGQLGLYLNDNRVTDAEFQKRLKDLHPSKDQPVTISADKSVPYDSVVHVMDMMAAEGIHKVWLPTKHVP